MLILLELFYDLIWVLVRKNVKILNERKNAWTKRAQLWSSWRFVKKLWAMRRCEHTRCFVYSLYLCYFHQECARVVLYVFRRFGYMAEISSVCRRLENNEHSPSKAAQSSPPWWYTGRRWGSQTGCCQTGWFRSLGPASTLYTWYLPDTAVRGAIFHRETPLGSHLIVARS